MCVAYPILKSGSRSLQSVHNTSAVAQLRALTSPKGVRRCLRRRWRHLLTRDPDPETASREQGRGMVGKEAAAVECCWKLNALFYSLRFSYIQFPFRLLSAVCVWEGEGEHSHFQSAAVESVFHWVLTNDWHSSVSATRFQCARSPLPPTYPYMAREQQKVELAACCEANKSKAHSSSTPTSSAQPHSLVPASRPWWAQHLERINRHIFSQCVCVCFVFLCVLIRRLLPQEIERRRDRGSLCVCLPLAGMVGALQQQSEEAAAAAHPVRALWSGPIKSAAQQPHEQQFLVVLFDYKQTLPRTACSPRCGRKFLHDKLPIRSAAGGAGANSERQQLLLLLQQSTKKTYCWYVMRVVVVVVVAAVAVVVVFAGFCFVTSSLASCAVWGLSLRWFHSSAVWIYSSFAACIKADDECWHSA